MTRFHLALTLLMVVGVTVAAPVPKKKAIPFPFAVGTKWEYMHDGNENDVWVEEVVESTEKDGVITFKVNITPGSGGKRFETYRLTEGELVIIATQDGTFDPPMLIAKAGMKDGDTWQNEWKLKGDGYDLSQKTTLTVGKAEEITTPAGKFIATPISRKQEGQGVSVWWFVDGVGLVRQTTDGQKEPEQELKAFTLGKM